MNTLHRMLRLGVAVAALSLSGSCLAWKPKTHIYLADLVLRDIKNGKITLYKVDHVTGENLGVLGEYAVDQNLVDAITANRKIFNAGVLGPDAFPDIVTGQCSIHPQNSMDEGSNSWLEHIWRKAQQGGAKERAFAAGYLFHAAGDMYAHTYMNHFAGGPFDIGRNAVRHIVLEGLIGKYTPTISSKSFSISMGDGDNTVRDFIYNNMINATLGSTLENKLLIVSPDFESSALSVPRVFSRLRNSLSQEVDELNLSRNSHDPLLLAKKLYLQSWIKDIEDGLKEWPYFSERLARILVYPNKDRSLSEVKEDAADECNDFVNHHLLSMCGAPDFVGLTRGQISDFVDGILDPFKDKIDEIKESLLNSIFKALFDQTFDEFVDKLVSPENYFDSVMGAATRPAVPEGWLTQAATTTLADFKSKELKLSKAGEVDWNAFPPAFNTIQMTKLILLPRDSLSQLVKDLRAAQLPVPESTLRIGIERPGVTFKIPDLMFLPENAMLGFDMMLDNSIEWRVHQSPNQMFLVRNFVYNKLFMKELGEDDRPLDTGPVVATPSANIKVTITRVKAMQDVDPFPGQGQADFFGRITIDDAFKSFATIDNDSDASPSNWSLTNKIVAKTVTVRIRLFDEDLDAADVCDICPRDKAKTLKVTVNLKNGEITGDASGHLGDSLTVAGAGSHDDNRCQITFKIEKV
jgi:hypothetical protein